MPCPTRLTQSFESQLLISPELLEPLSISFTMEHHQHDGARRRFLFTSAIQRGCSGENHIQT
jgi:hypothetical protein